MYVISAWEIIVVVSLDYEDDSPPPGVLQEGIKLLHVDLPLHCRKRLRLSVVRLQLAHMVKKQEVPVPPELPHLIGRPRIPADWAFIPSATPHTSHHFFP